MARRALEEYASDFAQLAHAVGLPNAKEVPNSIAHNADLMALLKESPETIKAKYPATWFAWTIYERVKEKLHREPVEDFRIDFEDGYGNRSDAEEDGHAVSVATEVAKGLREHTLPPFLGIRIKPFTEELRARSMRTFDLFVTTLLEQTGGKLPPNFVVMFPKVVMPEQVTALVDLFDLFEQQAGLPTGTLKMEMMIETTQSIINERGEINLPRLLAAAHGRVASGTDFAGGAGNAGGLAGFSLLDSLSQLQVISHSVSSLYSSISPILFLTPSQTDDRPHLPNPARYTRVR